MLLNYGVGEDSWVPLIARRSNQSILKEISPEYSLEGLMLKLKLQNYGHLMWRTDSLENTLMLGKIEGRKRRRWQRMRWLDGITYPMSMSLSNFPLLVMDRKAQHAAVHCIAKSWTWLSDSTDWTESACRLLCCVYSGPTNKDGAQPDSWVNKWITVLLNMAQQPEGQSVQFSCSVVPNTLLPHGLHPYSRPPCPSLNPGVYSNSCPLYWWCHPTISSSIIPFSSCLQIFPASGSFQMSQLFASGGQSIGVSASTSVLPMNTQDWYPL